MIENLCEYAGKKQYDKKSAQTLRNARGKWGFKTRIYHCEGCGKWHLTGKPLYGKEDYLPSSRYK